MILENPYGIELFSAKPVKTVDFTGFFGAVSSTIFRLMAWTSKILVKLKIRWANPPCGFESHHRHHVEKTLKMSNPRKRGFSIGQGLFSFPHATRFAGLARGPRLAASKVFGLAK